MGTLRFNTWQNPDGTQNFKCRAWVNFDGNTGAIRASGNVSSVTVVSAGVFRVNFTTSMPDANFAVTCLARNASGGRFIAGHDGTPLATTSVTVQTYTGVGPVGSDDVFVTVFR